MVVEFFLEFGGEKNAFQLEEGQEIPFGRSTENGVRFPADPGMSKAHASISIRGGQAVIEDLGSRNGTFLNGVPITMPRALRTGDLFSMGNTEVRFLSHGAMLPLGTGIPLKTAPGLTRVISLREIRDERKRPATEPTTIDIIAENRRMGVLQDIASALLDQRDPECMFRQCLDLVTSVIPSRRGCLMLLEEGELSIKALSAGGQPLDMASGEILRFSKTIRLQVMERGTSVLTADAAGDPMLESAQSVIIQGIKSVMCVPLWNGDRTYGLIYLDSSFQEPSFNEKNLRLLTAIANLVTMKLEHFMHIRQLIEKKAMEKDLEFASDVQKFLVQPRLPEIPGYETAVFYHSCNMLGGDYYHCFPLADGRFLIVIADVMGKGVGAALLTSSLHAFLSAYCEGETPVDALMVRLNKAIYELCGGTFFITLFALVLDTRSNEIRYCNAGHNPAKVYGEPGVREYSDGGPVLGCLPDPAFSSGTMDLRPGERLVLYTDGVTEMEDPRGEMMDAGFLDRCLAETAKSTCAESAENILKRIREFLGGAKQRDDMTAILVRRLRAR